MCQFASTPNCYTKAGLPDVYTSTPNCSKFQSILFLVLESLNASNVAIKMKLFHFTLRPHNSIPSFPTDIFWLFGVFESSFKIKKHPNLHVCVLLSLLYLVMLQLLYVQAAVPLLCLSGVLPDKGTHKVILGQSLKVIVGDGRGVLKE